MVRTSIQLQPSSWIFHELLKTLNFVEIQNVTTVIQIYLETFRSLTFCLSIMLEYAILGAKIFLLAPQ